MDEERIIKDYINGKSLRVIAKEYKTYPMTIRRLLIKHGVELRHDVCKKGDFTVKDGEKLIEWAKKQKRLVTKTELASVLGKTKLSPSYFVKYPELGKYIVTRENQDIREYANKLYDWLKKNHIQYKPNDRKRLKVSISALLLEEYKDLAIQIQEKPTYISKKKHEDRMKKISVKAKEVGITVVFLNKEHFENLDNVKTILDDLKKD